MDFYKYKMQLPNGIATTSGPESTIQLEMQRMQLELQRRDSLIEEQQKRIYQLEDELKRSNKQMQDMIVQLSNYKDQKQKSETNYKPAQSRYWTAEEHDRFLDAVKRYGSKDVKAIANYVGTRNPTQVRTHAQKYYLRLERERKRREDEVPGQKKEDGEGSKSEGEQVATPPLDDENSDEAEEKDREATAAEAQKKASRKRASAAGRRASLPVDMSTARPEQSIPTSPSPTVVHSTRQQLQSAAPIVSSLKGWTPQEYNAFIEGLLSFPEEKDINKKCKLISEKYLPKYSPEDIKQCYAILHNYVRNKETAEESHTTTFLGDSAKRPRIDGGMHGFGSPTYTTTAMPPSPDNHPVNMRYNFPYQGTMRGYPTPYGPHPYQGLPIQSTPYGAEAYQAYAIANGQFNAANEAFMRRASYPMDSFSASKAANPSEYSEFSENLFPPEIPTNWGSNTESSQAQSTSSSTTNHTDDMNTQSTEGQRGNNL